MPILSYTLLHQYFSLFQKYTEERDGHPLRSFSYGFLAQKEGYKGRLYDEARILLNFHLWQENQIGSGSILESVISAIEHKDNNIVKHQARYGEESREHYSLLEAKENPAKRREWEQSLFQLYRNDDPTSDREVFERMLDLAGKRYALISYLLFLKNKRRYVPNSPTNFDRAFEALGATNFRTSHQCSWENYQAFLSLITQAKLFLDEEMQESVDLLDAHSFLWIVSRDLIKHSSPPSTTVVVPEELHLKPVAHTPPRRTKHNGPLLFDEASMLKEQKEHGRIGRLAEQVVFAAEVALLEKMGKPELAKKVQIVSQDMSLGYDILSYYPDGEEKRIEVKGTTSQHGGIFYLTANELLRSEEVPGYHLYIVTGIGTDHLRIRYIAGPSFRTEEFALEPLSYRVRYHAEA